MVDKALAAAGYKEKIWQGDGYVYFIEGDSHRWYGASLPIFRIAEMTPEEYIVERNRLATDYRNSSSYLSGEKEDG